MLKLYKRKLPEPPVSIEKSERAMKEIGNTIMETYGDKADFAVIIRVPMEGGGCAFTPFMKNCDTEGLVNLCAIAVKNATTKAERNVAVMQFMHTILSGGEAALIKADEF